MMGAKLQSLLMLFYTILTIVYLCEGQWAKALYWTGALIITSAVYLMKQEGIMCKHWRDYCEPDINLTEVCKVTNESTICMGQKKTCECGHYEEGDER